MTLRDAIRQPAADVAERYRTSGMWSGDTLGALIARTLDDSSSQQFTLHAPVGDHRCSIRDLAQRAWRIATALTARGIGPADVVAVQLPNGLDAVASFCAVALTGAVIVPIVHYYSATDAEFIIRATRARALLTADRSPVLPGIERAEELLRTVDHLELVAVATQRASLPHGLLRLDELAGEGQPRGTLPKARPQDPAIVAFTSGTTAAPKGAIHTHETFCFEARQFAATIPAGPPIVMGAPVSHILGLSSGVLAPLLNTGPIHLLDGWRPAEVLELMTREEVRAGSGPPIFLTSLLDEPACTDAHVRLIDPCRLGGAPVPESLVLRGESLGLTVLRIYGSTEHPSVTSGFLDDPRDKRLTTVGRALPGVEIRIAPDGEILTRGPDLFAGYTDSALTAAAFDRDGWFATGDIGALDSGGYLTILDRKKDIIIRGGENISALEVEELLSGVRGVAEVAVIGAPDNRLGESVLAVVRRRPDAPEIELSEVHTFCHAHDLARHKWPVRIEFVDDFPRTPSGKIVKSVLREQLRAPDFVTKRTV